MEKIAKEKRALNIGSGLNKKTKKRSRNSTTKQF